MFALFFRRLELLAQPFLSGHGLGFRGIHALGRLRQLRLQHGLRGDGVVQLLVGLGGGALHLDQLILQGGLLGQHGLDGGALF